MQQSKLDSKGGPLGHPRGEERRDHASRHDPITVYFFNAARGTGLSLEPVPFNHNAVDMFVPRGDSSLCIDKGPAIFYTGGRGLSAFIDLDVEN